MKEVVSRQPARVQLWFQGQLFVVVSDSWVATDEGNERLLESEI
jgi:hypothetical protein